ncbi:hypothetical protein AJ88_03200 [Mesorhizobium amorphae CCBAU 01583]|nr:hypothetical protein AJ88_03200 [Mesorhizobium amorphae CCBAU 01583]
MNGGAGNDTYYVDNVLDNVIDEAGLDQIFSSVTYSLAVDRREVENLRLTGNADAEPREIPSTTCSTATTATTRWTAAEAMIPCLGRVATMH